MVRKKILIIDDEEDLCHLMKAYLTELNYEVFLANSLNVGLILMQQVLPDIVFIDNNLPDGMGWEKMDFLRQEYPQCKINLISAYRYLPQGFSIKGSTVKILEKPLHLHSLKDYL